MSIVSKQYTGNGSTKNFASDFKILSESHVDVLVDGVSISKSDYDTINSSVVFAAAPASGSAVVVRVGTTPDDLLTSTTNIDTVAANIADINTIEDNLVAINTTATNISSVTTNATNIANINTVADIGSDGLQGIVDNVDNIETVASVYNQVQTVAGIANAVSTVSSNSAAIVAAGDNTTNINTVAGNSTNINTLAADIAEINEIYTNRAEIYQADTNAATATAQATIATTKASQASASASAASSSASAASSSASAASGSASTATTQASNASSSASAASSSATSASNSASAAASSASLASSSSSTATTKASEASASALSASTDLATFQGQYTSSATVPTGSDEGDLWFDETTDIMKVYNGNAWQSAGSSVNGTSERQTYTATSGQTVFSAIYDAGYIDVYLNGIKLLDGTDFTAINGTSIVLSSGANDGDIVDIVAYGTFELANHYTMAQTDALLGNVGKVLQVVHQSFSDDIVVTASLANLFQLAITPKSATSKILINFCPQGRMIDPYLNNAFEYGFKISRQVPSSAIILDEMSFAKSNFTTNGSNLFQTIIGVGEHIDEPNTTDEITYFFDMKVGGNGTFGTMQVNHYGAVSTITLTEIGE